MKVPDIFTFNDDQTVVFIAAGQDVLFVKLECRSEIDVDQIFSITDVKACIFLNKTFYVIANKYRRVKGIYFLRIEEK